MGGMLWLPPLNLTMIDDYEKIYKKIPASKCKDGCFECCINMIQFHPDEEKNMGGYNYNDKCPHLINGKCNIYTKRPFVCRIYGSSEILACKECIPDKVLSKDETMALFHEYAELRNKK